MFKNETRIGYSLALFEIAKEEKKIKEFYSQSNLLISILESNKEFEALLDSFSLTDQEKIDIISKTFKGIDISFINSMSMLAIKNKFRHFREILSDLIKYLEDVLKIKQGIIYSTFALDSKKITQMENKVSKHLNCQVKLKNLIDKELIAGFKIIVDSIVIEDSIKSDLNLLKNDLKINKGGV